MVMLLKIALVPLVVLLASLAGRRFGHTATGWIAGLPLIAGPIFVFLAIDHPASFVADAARASLAVTAASILHCLAFAHMCVRFNWVASLAAGWTTFFVVGGLLASLALPIWAAFAVSMAALAVTVTWMPRVRALVEPVTIPGIELGVRVAAAFVLALVVTLGAPILGPALSGLLLTFPISGSIIPAFTRALHGPAAAVLMLRGFTSGMISFALFIFGIAAVVPRAGVWWGITIAIALSLTGYFAMRIRAERRA